jgi:hypothetical protein
MPTIRPAVKLVGIDGNAFSIIGACVRAARKAKMPAEDIAMIQKEMTSGSYDHLLATAMKYFAVEGEEDEEEDDENYCEDCGSEIDSPGQCEDCENDENEEEDEG